MMIRLLFLGIVAYFALPVEDTFSKDTWEGVYTDNQAKRGMQLYLENCSECHGSQLQGREEAPSLKQGAFIYNWDGMPVSILFQRIRETMPMDDPTSVSRKTKADILAYIMKENDMPSGNIPLPYQNSKLKRIQWSAQKNSNK